MECRHIAERLPKLPLCWISADFRESEVAYKAFPVLAAPLAVPGYSNTQPPSFVLYCYAELLYSSFMSSVPEVPLGVLLGSLYPGLDSDLRI